MDTKKFLTGTVVGGITYFFLGYLFYGLLFEDYFNANLGSATGVFKADDLIWWALILGNLSGAGLLSYIFLKWAHISTFKSGLRAGAAIGFLMTLSWDLISFATSNVLNLQAAMIDVAIGTVMTALAGAAIGAVLHAKPDAGNVEA